MAANVRIKNIDGQWEELGSEATRYRGVWPENFTANSNEWGPDRCSFDLRRDPGAIHPDLSAFSDVEVYVDGLFVWSGRIIETPMNDSDDPVINVQCEGWQYHLDDDLYKKVYVHNNTGDWQDCREHLSCNLGLFRVAGQASGTTFGWSEDDIISSGQRVGIMLDLGEDMARRIVVTWEMKYAGAAGPGGGINIAFTYADDPAVLLTGGVPSAFAVTPTPAAAIYTNAVTLPSPARYLAFIMVRTGGTVTLAGDYTVTMRSALVCSNTAYEAGNASILGSEQVVKDSLVSATKLLSSDLSEVKNGQFAGIPEFVMGGHQPPREVIAAVNAYENYETKVDIEKRLLFRPRVTSPIYEIGEWSGAEFQDTSANSGQEIINKVIAEGNGPAGDALSIVRYAAQLPNTEIESTTDIFFPNPSFDVDLGSWVAVNGSASRDTTLYHSFPASMRNLSNLTTSGGNLNNATWDGYLHTSCTGPGLFQKGRTYIVRFRLQSTSGYSNFIRFGRVNEDTVTKIFYPTAGSGFTTFDLAWVPKADYSSSQVRFSYGTFGGITSSHIDSIQLFQSAATLIDRRKFMRARALPIQNAITEASGTRIADLYLQDKATIPFTGSFRATGAGGVRRVLGGQSVHPAYLLAETGQMVRATHVIDPDTGGLGRDARIVNVSYSDNDMTSDVSLSNNRGSFEALLSRLAVVIR